MTRWILSVSLSLSAFGLFAAVGPEPAGIDLLTMAPTQDEAQTLFADAGDATKAAAHRLQADPMWIAASASAPGVGSSLWRTDLAVVNRSASALDMTVTLHEASGTSSMVTQIPATASRLLTDVVAQILGPGTTGSGALEITADPELLITSRTYNASPDGTFGQYLPCVVATDGITAGDTGWLPQLAESSDFRTNLGVLNMGQAEANVLVSLYEDTTDDPVGTFTLSIPPESSLQANAPYFNRFGRNDIVGGFASINVVFGSDIWMYASVIDNRTGDPTTIPMLTDTLPAGEPSGDGTTQWIAASASAAGVGGSFWKTDIAVVNRSPWPLAVTLTFHGSSGPSSLTSQIPTYASMFFPDVVGQILGPGGEGSGALEIWADQDFQEFLVTSRTFNDSPGGTFGQYLPGVFPAQGLAGGETAWLPHLSENADFRTNIGVLNMGSTAATVRVDLYEEGGTADPVGSFTLSVPAGSALQDNAPYSRRFGQTSVTGGFATITVDSGDQVWAYASVVDNRTGDPTTIPMLN